MGQSDRLRLTQTVRQGQSVSQTVRVSALSCGLANDQRRLTLIGSASSWQPGNGFPGLEGTQVTNYSLWQAKPSETRRALGRSHWLLCVVSRPKV